ncbi:hypothetical protein, partial [Streptomyces microflavus]|uniref:hypothetical protein n=1 Tax=Streptomyces microflavus TaxID=1919 RepID=UPI0033AA5EB7
LAALSVMTVALTSTVRATVLSPGYYRSVLDEATGEPRRTPRVRQLRNGPVTSYVMPPDELPLVPRCEEK